MLKNLWIIPNEIDFILQDFGYAADGIKKWIDQQIDVNTNNFYIEVFLIDINETNRVNCGMVSRFYRFFIVIYYYLFLPDDVKR